MLLVFLATRTEEGELDWTDVENSWRIDVGMDFAAARRARVVNQSERRWHDQCHETHGKNT